jgi:hypothetical protein
MAVPGCSRTESRLEQHRQSFESLGATTAAIGDAWLAGQVSGTYARTAFEDTLRLVEQERTALASRPELLADPRGAELSQSAEQLSRLLAGMIGDVRHADGSSVRRHLAGIPLRRGART